MTFSSASSAKSAGFSPTPIPDMNGEGVPTLIAQPFFRQLESVSFTFTMGTSGNDVGFFLEFIESGEVFNRVFLPTAVSANGNSVNGVFAQRIQASTLTVNTVNWMQTALPVGFWVEPNVSVRLRAEGGTSSDSWSGVVFMLSQPMEKKVE